MGITISLVDPGNDADIDSYHGVTTAVQATDHPELPQPSRDQTAGLIRAPRPTHARHSYVAWLDGRPVGTLRLQLPQVDNTHLVHCELAVHPHHRRRGVARSLWEFGVAFARDRGRRLLTGDYCIPYPPGPPRDPAPAAFAAAMQVTPVITMIHRRLDLRGATEEHWHRLLEDARPHADGYTPVWWSGATPEDLVADVARLEGRMVLDIPLGGLEYEPERYDTARIRAQEEVARQRGETHLRAGMRHDATGSLVAWTELKVGAGESEVAWQSGTLVEPGHRGHRLGMLVKLHNLRRSREAVPTLWAIDTFNAEQNRHMVAINEALGFAIVDGWMEWQYQVTDRA